MAKILPDYELDNGIIVPEAYAELTYFDMIPGTRCRQVWTIYSSKDAFSKGKPSIGSQECVLFGEDCTELIKSAVNNITISTMNKSSASFLENAKDI